MMFWEFLRVGWTVIGMHKFRSALTLLSIAIGTFSIVLMASLAASATATISQGLEDLGGARMIIFFPQRPEKAEKKGASYSRGLTVDDADALRGRIPYVRYYEVHRTLGDREVSDASQQGLAGAPPVRKSGDLVAANQDFFDAFGMTIAAGRALHPDDLVGRRRVVVLGHGVAQALFPTPEAALGRVVRAGTDSFRVIGVTAKLTRLGMTLDFDWNNFLAVPLTIGMTADSQTAMLLVTEGVQYNDAVKRLAAAIISDRHNHVDDFKVFDFGVVMEKFYGVFRIMQLIAGLIASVALLVGGMGVMNILLVSVSERVREIGIRKAIGASDQAVGMQFLFESALLSGLGGVVGAALGSAGVFIAGMIINAQGDAGDGPGPWISVVSHPALVAALVSSVLIGVFFGLVPARKAGKLQVVDCLRAAG
jgi:putative ABC transport system permease protein